MNVFFFPPGYFNDTEVGIIKIILDLILLVVFTVAIKGITVFKEIRNKRIRIALYIFNVIFIAVMMTLDILCITLQCRRFAKIGMLSEMAVIVIFGIISINFQNRNKTFNTWESMYKYLKAGNDLYNPDLKTYVFCYNDKGALCFYDMDADTYKKLKVEAKQKKERISSLLGAGGYILEDDSFMNSVLGFDENDYKRYIAPSYNFCKETYESIYWYKA